MSKKIFIDAGHSKSDSGAVGKHGTKERDITLAVSLKVSNYLHSSGFEVGMSRKDSNDNLPSNVSKDLIKRVQMSNDFKADAFVSLHCNAATNPNAKGFEIFTTPGQNNSDVLATKIHSRVKTAFPNLVYREDISDGDPDKEAQFYVIRYAKSPATLVEMLFISNPDEEKMLNDPTFQDKMAFAIAQGIGDYFGVKVEKQNNNQPNQTPKIIIGDKIFDAILHQGSTLAPIRVISESLGFPVQFDNQTKEVIVNGVKIKPIIIDNISYCSIRYLFESLNYKVNWDNETKTAHVYK